MAVIPQVPPPGAASFTLGINDASTGIGDQLFQTQLLYNLGRTCGWDYLHDPSPRPWLSRDSLRLRERLLPSFSYHDFLGLTLEERRLPRLRGRRVIDLDAYDLLAHAVAGAACPTDGPPPPPRRGGELVRIWFNPWFYEEYERRPPGETIPCRWQLDLRRKYLLARRRDPVPLPFTPGRIPVVLFLRLMELTWHERDGALTIPLYPHQRGFRAFVARPDEYMPLLRTILEVLGRDQVELWVYSDGLPRERWLSKRLAATRGMPAGEARQLARDMLTAHQRRFAELAQIGCPVGFRTDNSVALIREVIHAFVMAAVALAPRKTHTTSLFWRPAFPDLGARDPASRLPVIGINDGAGAALRARLGEDAPRLRPWRPPGQALPAGG